MEKSDMTLQTVLYKVVCDKGSVASNRLKDEEYIASFIDHIIYEIDMTVIYPTVCVELPLQNTVDKRMRQPNPEDEGLSLITMISESHIAVHTWSKLGMVMIDISSCKPFDEQVVRQIVHNYFGPCQIKRREVIL